MTTVSDPEGRATVMDLLHGVKERVYPVGRLDYHSEGLLLFTNDGELANAIMSAATHLPKTYLVKVNGALTADQEQKFREGVPLSGRRTVPAGLKMMRDADNPWYEVKLIEGRNNQIRMMFKHFGRLVEKLKRVRIGPHRPGPAKPGEFRHLDADEVEKLKRAIQQRRARTEKPYEAHSRDSAIRADHRGSGAFQQAISPQLWRGGVSAEGGISHHSGESAGDRSSGREVLSGPGFGAGSRSISWTSSAAPNLCRKS